MTLSKTPFFVAFLALIALAVAGIAQQSATEAAAGFDTPTLGQNPGSQSISNGTPEPPGDTFALDQTRFERRNGVDDGLGPVFNATACADCHQNPVINRHRGEAREVIENFREELTPAQQQQVLVFLRTL